MDEFTAHVRHVQSSDGVDVRHMVSGFNWEGVQEGGRVVDVGGSTGSAAIALARKFPHLSFIVQDLPANAETYVGWVKTFGKSTYVRVPMWKIVIDGIPVRHVEMSEEFKQELAAENTN
ncbi:uncharacterized protein BHQ10_009453 [Talaromyces amestolkiae]|uniref:O-methyltransferase C-terminal domain-containing protein n=1 Tax=Talaromyces amestolkiae TaxID=1196081 RepID=A0A364LCJ2_TALAM|nr:uncharacterized protein BHQ10_009453 [Talaromyces amestolkiae]RAO73441.1 hypothetical protein BHQ10_009453 [Talaromyces amestolkiae]